MKLEIEVLDYFDKNEIRGIIKHELICSIRKDAERILSNMSYHIGENFIDNLLTDEDKTKVKSIVKKHLTDEKTISYELFRRKDVWNPELEGTVSHVFSESVRENKELIKEKVSGCLREMSYEVLSEKFIEIFPDTLIKLIKDR